MDLRLATLKQSLSICCTMFQHWINAERLAGKVFTHKCDTGNLSALIQCWNIVQQIERDCFNVAKRRSIYIYIYIYIYTTLAFLALLGAPYIYIHDISSLRVKNRRMKHTNDNLIIPYSSMGSHCERLFRKLLTRNINKRSVWIRSVNNKSVT